MAAGLSWTEQGQSRWWDVDVQLCVVLRAAGWQSVWWHQSVGSWACTCMLPGDSVGSLLFEGRKLKLSWCLRSPKETVSARK